MSAMLKIALIVWMYGEDICRVKIILYINTRQKFEILLRMSMSCLPYDETNMLLYFF